jgi:hypothetical protein
MIFSGAVVIPGSWTLDCSRSAGMSDERRASAEYSWARQVSAVLLIAVVVVIVVLHVIVEDYEVRAPVLVDRPKGIGHSWVRALIRRLPR